MIGYDRTEEHEYWCHYTAQYGRNVLIPFCAFDETDILMRSALESMGFYMDGE